MFKFLKCLLWQPQWIPLVIAMLAGALYGLMSENAQAWETYDSDPSWEEYSVRISDNCPKSVANQFEKSLEKYRNFFPVTLLDSTNLAEVGKDDINLVSCDPDFSRQALIYSPFSYTVETVYAKSGAVLGLAHIWWTNGTFIEADIQLDPTVEDDWLLEDLIDHELGHVAGCAHSDNISALMYHKIIWDKSFHYDDLQCLHYLYQFSFSVLDYRGNIFIPDAREIGKRNGWGVVTEFSVLDYGINHKSDP